MLDSLSMDMESLESSGVDLSNYAGLWCIEDTRFSQIWYQLQRMDLAKHIASNSQMQTYDTRGYAAVGRGGSVAVVEISGVMTKKGSSMARGGSTLVARRSISQAANDESISAIILRIDSPGGTVSGTEDLARTVQEANQKKPVVAFIEDLCASAACWVACQCREVYANGSTAQIGSIGTYLGLYDLSQMAEKEGIKPVLIKAGEFKGGGFPGMEISDAQIEKWQSMIDATQAEFTKAVSTGRKLSLPEAQKLVTGLTYMADEAQRIGLIDGIRSFNAVVDQLQKSQTGVRQNMNAASFNEIVQKCTGIQQSISEDAMFITDCQSKNLSVEAAQDAWLNTLIGRAKAARDELSAKDKEISDLEAKNTELEAELAKVKSASGGIGVKAVGTKASGSSETKGDAKAEFDDAVQKKVSAGMSRQAAVMAVNRENPDLRKALVDSVNSK